MLTAVALLAALCVASLVDVEVVSPNGSHEAEIRKAPGQERVADAIARWRLSVFERPRAEGAKPTWTCLVPSGASAGLHVLSEDGRAFAAIETEHSEARTLVRVWRTGEVLAELSAARLGVERRHLPRDDARRWLAEGDAAVGLEWIDTPRGPVQFLRLTTSYDALRLVDLESGNVRTSREQQEALIVEPPASRAEKPGLRVARVEHFQVGAPIVWGEALQVTVFGAHPSANWLFVGFELAQGAEDRHELFLTPISAPPAADSVQAQLLVNFNATARIQGLAPGRYRLHVATVDSEGVAPTPFEVLPARPALELRRSGGFIGLDQSIRVYASGVAVDQWLRPVREPATRFGMLRRADRERIVDLVGILGDARDTRRGAVSDAIECELTLYDSETPRTFRFREPGVGGALLDLASVLERVLD